MPQPLLPALIYLALLATSTGAGWLVAGPLTLVRTHSCLERLLLYWLLGVVALSWTGTILAAMGYFRWWLVLALVLVLGAWIRWRARPRGAQEPAHPSAPIPTPWPAMVLAIIALSGAGWLFARPAESYMLTDDSAVYILGGIVLARQGTLSFEPQVIYDLGDLSAAGGYWDASAVRTGAEASDIWLPRKDFLRQFAEIEIAGVFSRHFGPFYQWTLARQTLEIGFLPLSKVWIAFVTWLFGPDHAAWAIPFLGLTGMAALYGLVRRTLGWTIALVTVLLLMVSLPQIWFARFPISEVPTQALLAAGLYLAVLARQQPAESRVARLLAIWSALGLASLTILRFEGLVILTVLALLIFFFWHRTRVSGDLIHLWLSVIVVSGVCGFVLGLSVTPYYFFTRTVALLGPTTVRVIVPLLASAVLAIVAFYQTRRRNPARLWLVVERAKHYLPLACASMWVAWGATALVHLLRSPWSSSMAGWLVQYWTRPGLLLSVVGALGLLWAEHRAARQPELAAFLGLASLLLAVFSVHALVNPVHPWAMRRLVPVVMPALAIGAAVSLARGCKALPLSRLGDKASQILGPLSRLLAGAALALLALSIGQRSYPLLLHQERQGMWSGLADFAQRLPVGAVLLFDDTAVSRGLTQPMELVFGHPSFILQDTDALRSKTPLADRLVEATLAMNRSVYLVITEGMQPDLLSGWQLAGRGASRLDNTVLAMPWGRVPRSSDIIEQSFVLDTYEVLPAAQESSARAHADTIDIPIGAGSYPFLSSGFYPWALDEAATALRWTRDVAVVRVPWPELDNTTPVDRCLRIDLSNWRDSGEPLRLVVEAEGAQLFAGSLDGPMGRQILDLPISQLANEGLSDLEIQMHSSTFVPQDPTDQRELGLLLYGMQLLPANQCPPQ